MKKPGARSDLTLEEAERILIIAIDWATYRTLHGELGLTHTQLHEWMCGYYKHMFLDELPATPEAQPKTAQPSGHRTFAPK